MKNEAFRQMCRLLSKRGGRYPGRDIPEFYALVEELFSLEEAEAYNAIPRGWNPASVIADGLGKDEEWVRVILEAMADKGLCSAWKGGAQTLYHAPVLDPGIFELQFWRGTETERDRRLAKLIRAYKAAVDALQGPEQVRFAMNRVIPIDTKIEGGSTIHTYDQVAYYLETNDPVAVSKCFCRHGAKLID